MLFAILLAACADHPAGKPPADEATPCGEGEIPDDSACVPEACGAGTWGNLSVDDDTVYIDIDAVGDGDGSEAAPLTSVQAGVDLAGDRGGGLVAVAAGTYVEAVAMGGGHDGVTLAGRCRDLVTIDGSAGDKLPVIQIVGARKRPAIGIDGLTMRGGTYGGLWVQQATVSVRASDVRENATLGIVVGDAEVILDDVGVYDSQPDQHGDWGRGIDVEGGAALTATGCTIRGNRDAGLVATGAGTEVTLVDAQVLDTAPSADGTGGSGVAIQDGATLSATGCTVQGNSDIGVFATGARTTVELVDDLILDTLPSPDGTGGRGIGVESGAGLTATGCTVQGNTEVGVLARDEGTTIDLVETTIRDTLALPDGTAGIGLQVGFGAMATADRCTIQGNRMVGVSAWSGGTAVDLVDTEVLDTAQSVDGMYGEGISVQGGATLTASGCTVGENTEIGVLAVGAGTTVDLTHTQVRATQRGRETGFGLGVTAQLEARIRADHTGISDTEGPGVYVVQGGRVELVQVELTGNTFAGAVALDGSLDLDACSITGTRPDKESGGGFGVYGTAAFGPPDITLTGSTIGPHDYAAVWLDGPGTYDVEGNQLSGSDGVAQGGSTLHGNAVFAENGVAAWDGTTGLLLSDNLFTSASAIGVLLDDSSAGMDRNEWSGNAVGLRQQACNGPDHVAGPNDDGLVDDVAPLTEADTLGAPSAQVCPASNVLIAYDLAFTTLFLPEIETEE